MTPDNADIARRLRQTRADMLGTDDEEHYWDCHEGAAEIESLRLAIRRLAEQDATLSVQGGNATVTMDATLTDAEREAVAVAAVACASCNGFGNDPRIPAVYKGNEVAATLRGLLERFSHIARCESDRSQPIATPTPPSTPDECTVPPEWTEGGGK